MNYPLQREPRRRQWGPILMILTLVACAAWGVALVAMDLSEGSAGATVRCYSSGVLFLSDTAAGNVHIRSKTNVYTYTSAITGKEMAVSGDCVLEEHAPR